MSEEAKTAYIQERIHEARRNQIIAYVVPFIIGFPSGALWSFMVGFLGLPWDFWEKIIFIYGAVFLVIGFGLGSYYGQQKSELMEQLRRMAESTSIQRE